MLNEPTFHNNAARWKREETASETRKNFVKKSAVRGSSTNILCLWDARHRQGSQHTASPKSSTSRRSESFSLNHPVMARWLLLDGQSHPTQAEMSRVLDYFVECRQQWGHEMTLDFFLSTRAFRFLARGDSNESYAWLIMRSFRKPRCCYTHRKRQQVLIRTFGCAAFDPNAALRTGEGCCM